MSNRTALSRVLLKTAADGRSPATDRELLCRFAEGDQGAFEVLVRRHTALVLGACRRSLVNLQDAEDACQATFLILARKARGGRWQPSIANWLFATARRVSRDLRRSQQRRARREGRVATPESTLPVDRMTGRELLDIIDEELVRLPSIYRELLLLHYHADLAREEIAARLSIPVATVKTRLERGRKKLGAALTQRGIVMSAGLLALVATSRAGASPPRLFEAIMAAVSGRPPAAVAALVEGAAMNGIIKKSAYLGLAVAAVVALGMGMGTVKTAQPSPDQPPAKAKPASAEQNPQDQKPISISGIVLDPAGRPYAGAKIYLNYQNRKETAWRPLATSRADGKFLFVFERKLLDDSDPNQSWFQVVACADGFGSDWHFEGKPAPRFDLKLRLVDDPPIRGRVVDLEGKPVKGARLRIKQITSYVKPEAFLETVRAREWPLVDSTSWTGSFPSQPQLILSDADGRFELKGAGRDRLVEFSLEGPAIQFGPVRTLVRDMQTVEPRNVREPGGGLPIARVYGATFVHVAAPSRPIRGVIRNQKTGQPIPNVRISSSGTTHQTTSDKDGRYELQGCAKNGAGYRVSFEPDGQHYFRRSTTFVDTPGFGPIDGEMKLHGGIVASGRLTNQATGRPVAGAYVSYVPLYPNPHVSVFGTNGAGALPCSSSKTGSDGSYRIVVLPGPGAIGFAAPSANSVFMPAVLTAEDLRAFFHDDADHLYGEMVRVQAGVNSWSVITPAQYNGILLINPDKKDRALSRDFALRPAKPIHGTLIGPDGKPLRGVVAYNLRPGVLSEPLAGDSFAVEGYNPRTRRLLLFTDKDRKIGAFVSLTGAVKEPLTVKLEACGAVSGRLLGQDGEPKVGAILRLDSDEIEYSNPANVKTDGGGRFRFEGLVPGQKYQARLGAGTFGQYLGAAFRLKAGQVHDLGDLKIKMSPSGGGN